MAYVWGWAMVNSFNRRAGITQAPAPGRLGGVVPVAPRGRLCMLNDYVLPKQSFVACPNQDVCYGVLFASLDEEPVRIFFPMVAPPHNDRYYRKVEKVLAQAFVDDEGEDDLRSSLLEAESPGEVIYILRQTIDPS